MNKERRWPWMLIKFGESFKQETLCFTGIIYDIYEKKIFADSVDDRECNPRQSLPAFVREYLSNKFGLAKLSEAHLLGILDAVREAEEEVTKKYVILIEQRKRTKIGSLVSTPHFLYNFIFECVNS